MCWILDETDGDRAERLFQDFVKRRELNVRDDGQGPGRSLWCALVWIVHIYRPAPGKTAACYREGRALRFHAGVMTANVGRLGKATATTAGGACQFKRLGGAPTPEPLPRSEVRDRVWR